MLIKGEKYACEACVRGHRVSSCTHSDRKLLHVNKKGRPVSQCSHCRSLRKQRSQHVKCECQDKAHSKEDCPHLQPENANDTDPLPTPPSSGTSEPHICCCGHGARCNCALKKDHNLDPVPEDIPQVLQPKEPHKPRISSLNNHEGKPTIFSNGHHKPVHKINDAHNFCGAPYRVPSRSHTANNNHRDIAQRSTDSLPLLRQAHHTESPLHNEITSAPRESRQTKSEHGSPDLAPLNPPSSGLANELYIPPLSPNAYSYSPFEGHSNRMNMNPQSDPILPENIPESWFTTYDEAHAMDMMPVTGLNDVPPVDWSTFDLTDNIVPYPAVSNSYFSSQMPSYTASYDHPRHPDLHRGQSSSGEISEADETPATNMRPSNLRTVSNASNDISSPGDEQQDNYRLSTASSFFGAPQANILAGNLDNLDIDEYVQQTVNQQKRLSTQTHVSQNLLQPQSRAMRQSPSISQSPQQMQTALSPQEMLPTPPHTESPRLGSQPRTSSSNGFSPLGNGQYGTEHAFTVSEAQSLAHMIENQEKKSSDMNFPLTSTIISDPMWSGMTDGSTDFKLDDEKEDEDWVR